LLKPHLSAIDLPVRRQLEGRNRRIEHIYFLRRGLASMVVSAGANHTIEVGGDWQGRYDRSAHLAESGISLHEIFMQSPGDGWRIGVDELQAALAKSFTLHQTLLRFAHVMVTQMSFTALANGRYRLEERLARLAADGQ